jgi:probable HAF family extracellular repeat protein
MHRYLPSVWLSLSLVLSVVAAAHAASYTFTTIDVPNALATQAIGINNQGQVLGYYSLDNDPSAFPHGFLYDKGRITTIDVPGALYTMVQEINNRGQIVGY